MKSAYQMMKRHGLTSFLLRNFDFVVKRRLPEHRHPIFVRWLSNHWVASDYEEEIRASFRKVCQERSLRSFYDVGSNVGIFALDFLALDPANRVVCFEPNPRVLTCLEATKRHGRIDRMEVADVALSDRTGWAELTFDPMSPAKGGLHPIRDGKYNHELDYGGISRSVRVRTDTLDNWIDHDTPPDILKIDAEGEELAILKGATGLLRRHRPILFFECSRDEGEIQDLLRSFGYEFRDARMGVPDRLGHFNLAFPPDALR